MAKEKNAGKPAKNTSVLGLIKSAGFEVSKQKTTLWAEQAVLAENVEAFDFYISTKYEGSSYAIIREEDESILIPFYKGEIDTDDYESSNDKGLVASDDVDFSIDIKEMVALRDDEELGITKGDKCLRAFVS
jgi:hypothetical protein